jgi:hypothetical protein
MNLRQFCREPGFPKALLLTFSVDGFFEEVILQDLARGRSSDILVMADHDEVARSLEFGADHLSHLGKRYLLNSVPHAGAFHPKMILRLGPSEGRVLVGTGNLTSAGWCRNMELAAHWKVGQKHEDPGAWILPLVDELVQWCATELEATAIRRIVDVPWLKNSRYDNDMSRVIFSSDSQTMSQALLARWATRKFDEVHILTGSTDANGAFLRWAHSAFGIKRAVVAITQANASFTLEGLSNLPVELKIVLIEASAPLHAKFYWFTGPEGAGAVMGSINCGASAWLVPLRSRGNMEMAVVYDFADAAEFATILSAFDGPHLAPSDVFPPSADLVVAHRVDAPMYRIASLRWSNHTETLSVIFRPPVPASATVSLTMGPRSAIALELSDGEWRNVHPLVIDFSSVPMAFAVVHHEGQVHVTRARWVDNVDELQRAIHAARYLIPIRDLDRETNKAEQNRLVTEISEIARLLIQDNDEFADAVIRERGRSRGTAGGDHLPPPVPVNPDDLIRSIERTRWANLHPGQGVQDGTVSPTLRGIIGLLFECQHKQRESPTGPELPSNGTGKEPPATPLKTRKFVEPDVALKRRIQTTVDELLARIIEPSFVESCSINRFVQASSFPLAVAILGADRGWVTTEVAANWTSRIAQLLMFGPTARETGLLERIRCRYEMQGLASVFAQTVGDGSLWILLVSAIASIQDTKASILDSAILLRALLRSPTLVATADPATVLRLLGAARVSGAREAMSRTVPHLSTALDGLEQLVSASWQEDKLVQQNSPPRYEAGDWLYRLNIGWMVCTRVMTSTRAGTELLVRFRGAEILIHAHYYVNVSKLAQERQTVRSAMESVRQAAASVRERSTAEVSFDT